MTALTLTVATGPSNGRSVARARGRLLVGRSSDADLRLDDVSVHWEHCVLHVSDGEVTLEAAALNATRVNERPVPRLLRLRDGDVIRISEASTLKVTIPADRHRRRKLRALCATAAVTCLLAAAVVTQVRAGPTATGRDWERSYLELRHGLDGTGRSDLSDDFQKAWRLDRQLKSAQARTAYASLAKSAVAQLRRVPETNECAEAGRRIRSAPTNAPDLQQDVIVALFDFASRRAAALGGR